MGFFLTDVIVMKMGYSEDEILAVLHESERDRKRRRVLIKVNETVAAHRLQKMKDLQALEFATRLWSEVNALKDAISLPARTRPWQKTIEFVDGLQGKFLDEELAVIKRYGEKRSHEAAQVTVTPIDTVQYCSPRPLNPKIPSDVNVKIEEKDKGWMNSEGDELESPPAGTGFETPGQQCHPIWETGRTTADGFLTAGVGSNLGKHTSPTPECVDTRAVRTTANITFLQQGHKPKDKEKSSEEINSSIIVGKEESSHRHGARL